MAYKRRSNRRKSRKPKSKSSSSLAKAVAIGLTGVALTLLKHKLGLNTETKYLDTPVASTSITTTCTGVSIPIAIPQGNTTNTRNGDGLRITSYKLSMLLNANSAATRTTMVRILIVKFRDSRGATMASDVFLDEPTNVNSFLNMGNTVSGGGYTILRDVTIPLEATSTEGNQRMFKFSWKPKNHHVKWTDADTTGASNNIITGLFSAFIFCNNGTNIPTYSAQQRVRFVDN